MELEQLLKKLIADGKITQDQFDQMVASKKQELERNPNTVPAQVTVLKDRTAYLQDIDNYALDLIFRLMARVEALEQSMP